MINTCAALVLSFATIDAAAIAATQETIADRRSREQEYAGAVFRCGDRYGYTPPRTSGQKDRVRLEVSLPRGSRLAAIYHTHPGMPSEARWFSEGDTEMARQLRVPSYIGVVLTGDVRVLRPGTFRPGFTTTGEVVFTPAEMSEES